MWSRFLKTRSLRHKYWYPVRTSKSMPIDGNCTGEWDQHQDKGDDILTLWCLISTDHLAVGSTAYLGWQQRNHNGSILPFLLETLRKPLDFPCTYSQHCRKSRTNAVVMACCNYCFVTRIEKRFQILTLISHNPIYLTESERANLCVGHINQQIMTCCLFGAEHLSEPNMVYCQLGKIWIGEMTAIFPPLNVSNRNWMLVPRPPSWQAITLCFIICSIQLVAFI